MLSQLFVCRHVLKPLYLRRSSTPATSLQQAATLKRRLAAAYEEEEAGMSNIYHMEIDAEPFACFCAIAESCTYHLICFFIAPHNEAAAAAAHCRWL